MGKGALFLAALVTIPTLAVPRIGPTSERSFRSAVAAPGFYFQIGDLLTAQHRFAAARMRYETAANLDRNDGILPVEAVRRIANTYYFEGAYDKARDKLVELAAEAERLGEWETQLWALADAAWLADLSGDDAGFESHLAQLETLLDSHEMPGARYKVRTMLAKNFTAFSPHLESW
jgi:tetratricopeptide (TPR) repeat protein